MASRTKDDELRIAALKHRIKRAQRSIRRYVKPGKSLADELIDERRAEAEDSKPSRKIRLSAVKKP
jgi:hypothetical protein